MNTYMAEWRTSAGTATAGTFQARDAAEVHASITRSGGTEVTVNEVTPR